MLPPWGSLSSCSFSQKPLQSSGRAERQGFHRLRRARQPGDSDLAPKAQTEENPFITLSSSDRAWSPYLRGCIPVHSIVVLATSVGGEREKRRQTLGILGKKIHPCACCNQPRSAVQRVSLPVSLLPPSLGIFFFPTALCWFRATTKKLP